MDLLTDKKSTFALLRKIEALARGVPSPVRVMEVCGTHTMTVHRHGLKSLLREAGIEMISGPGCPVCITPNAFHEAAIELVTGREGLILATFGDMTRVPTRRGALRTAIPAPGSSVRIVYSPEEPLALAARESGREVVFFGAGFETTIPSIALMARKARRTGLRNFAVLSALWTIPPPLRAILESGEIRLSGFLYPGHVTAVIGLAPYAFIAREFGFPGAVAGFEPADVLLGIISVLEQIRSGRPAVANTYGRVVRPEGNPAARAVMDEILDPDDSRWRGLGLIPRSGLRLKRDYADYDAVRKYGLDLAVGAEDLPGCRCGEVLRGMSEPTNCRLFGRACTPDSPRGPCMVSFEGACFVLFKYRDVAHG
ncbi:MAG: hydrogenase formation protein HypD [Candidatus Aminicenantes bacterium]|nr:hydrogenase formation protein HypD [Candidatus Aminicenantes bacterium]